MRSLLVPVLVCFVSIRIDRADG